MEIELVLLPEIDPLKGVTVGDCGVTVQTYVEFNVPAPPFSV